MAEFPATFKPRFVLLRKSSQARSIGTVQMCGSECTELAGTLEGGFSQPPGPFGKIFGFFVRPPWLVAVNSRKKRSDRRIARMAHQFSSVLRHIRQLVGVSDPTDDSDATLLRRFAHQQDEAAFATLLGRHGPLVLGVCRRVLNDSHEAEDAFQATFLLLVRKASSIRRPELLNNWLYGVAYRIARRAQARRQHAAPEEDPMDRFVPAPGEEMDRQRSRLLVDEELSRLPDKYRAPVLLCYVEGRTQEAAARHLGWSPGAVKGRLERARDLLRRRLMRRGVAPSAAALVAALADAASAEVPDRLVAETLRTGLQYAASGTVLGPAATLVEGALRGAFLVRAQVIGAVIVATALFGGGAIWLLPQRGDGDLPLAVFSDRGVNRVSAQPLRQSNRDFFGDPLPAGAMARIGTVRWRPGMQTNGLALSPDGKLVAVANEAGLSLWDRVSGTQLRMLSKGRVEDTVFTADGGTLVSLSGISVRSWEVPTGRLLRRFEPKPDGKETFVNYAALSADGQTFAAITSQGQNYNLNIYNVTTGAFRRRWAAPDSPFFLALTADGKTLASQSPGPDGEVIRLWDTATGKEVRRLTPVRQSIWRMAFSGDGKLLASGGHAPDGQATEQKATVLVWDMATGALRHNLNAGSGFAGSAYAVAFSADNRLLAAAGGDGTLRLWDTETGRERHCLRGHDSAPHAITFSRDGKTLIAGDNSGTVRLWGVETGQELTPAQGHSGWVGAVTWLPRSDTVVTHGDRTVRFWNAADGKELRQFTGAASSGVHCAAICPAKKLLATATYPYKEICLWDLEADKLVRRIETVEGTSTVAFAADGRFLAGVANDAIFLWDPESGKLRHRLQGHKDRVGCVAFSPDGRLIASGAHDNDQTVRLWDTATGKEIRRLVAPVAPPPPGTQFSGYGPDALAFGPDGKTIAACGSDTARYYICVWDVATGLQLRKIVPENKGKENRLFCLAFAPDGRTIAASGWATTAELWEVTTGTLLRRLEGHRGGVLSLAFSPDGRTLATGSQDTSALLWDLAGAAPEEAARAARLTEADLASLWDDLAAHQAGTAYRAVRTMAAAPRRSIPFLRERLSPARAVNGRQVERLIADLDDRKYEVRERASAELEKLGNLVETALEKALDQNPPLEVHKRLERLLLRIKGSVPSPAVLRGLRAVAVLELSGESLARELLTRLAKGAPEAPLTREAQAALRRIASAELEPAK